MSSCSEIEATIGIERYYIQLQGIGGIVKMEPEDFVVSEILDGGLDASILWSKDPLPMEPARNALWILRKRDRETIPTVSKLAKKLNVRPLKAMICGIKDRRAVTYQFVAIQLTRKAVNYSHITLNGAEAKRIGYIDKLSSSKLIGNRFEILIRGAEAADDLLQHYQEFIQEMGIPNFYGYQRFGLLRPVTHLVGRHIVRGDIRGAVELFLSHTTDFEPERVRAARRALAETGDLASALKDFPRSLSYERRILTHLSSNTGDYLGALRRLPLRIRKLFVHAYSAYLFNKALSISLRDGYRLDEPAVGDLFVRIDRFQRPYGRPMQATASNLEEAARRVASGEVSIIIPSPGYLSWMPRGPRGEALKYVMDEEGVRPSSFKLRVMREASTTGTHRPIMLKPLNLHLAKVDRGIIKLQMNLPPSGYATSILRELMKKRCALAYAGLEHCYT
ncbi:MAG: tRNA pseudouridine(13) synthase TruD [Nitrososphaerota archaeon]